MFARLRAIFVLGLAMVLCASSALSQDDRSGTIQISGRVVDSASFQIPNVAVTLKIVGMDQPLVKVQTDPDGTFTFPAASSNEYELHFEAIGFAPVTLAASQVIASGAVVMKVTAPAEAPIPSSIGIFGRLIDPSGAAVSNAVVAIQPPKPEQVTVERVRVDQEGNFVSWAASQQGPYEFRFSAPGFKPATKQIAQLTKGYIEVGTIVLQIGDVTDAPLKTTLCEAVNNSNHLTGHFVEVRTEIHASGKDTPMTLVLYDSSCSAVVLGTMLDGRSINAADNHTLRKNLDQHRFVEATVLGKFERLSTPIGSYRYQLTIHSISGVAAKPNDR